MTTLLHAPARVHSNYEGKACLPWQSDTAEYQPSLGDQLFELGRTIGLEGGTTHSASVAGAGGWSGRERLRWTRGVLAGRLEREAREIGHSLGESGSGISEPPPGMDPAERAAYREGYAKGLAEFQEAECWEAVARKAEEDEALDWMYVGYDAAMESFERQTDRLPRGVID